MTALELEITAEIDYVPYGERGENGGAAIHRNSGSESSSSYYSSSEEEGENVEPNIQLPSKKEPCRLGALGLGKRTRRLNPKLVRVVEGVALALAVAVVLTLFALPVYFYQIERAKNQSNSSELSPSVSPVTPSFVNSTVACSQLSWGTNTSQQCTGGTPYLPNDICTNQLLAWRRCIVGRSLDGPVMVAMSTRELEVSESDAEDVLQALETYRELSTPECSDIAAPFVCLYLFPLCDSGEVYSPSQELCLNISTAVCQRQWALAQAFGFGDQLPVCDHLPISDRAQNSTIAPAGPINISCSTGFYVENGICIPDCYTYISSPATIAKTNRLIIEIAITFGLVISIFIFGLSIVRRRVMWKFPYVFLVYVTIDYDILGLFILISIGDRGLYCSSRSAITALSNPTTFCTLTGIVVHYFVINMVYFWFFHVCSTFYKVVFPHLARRTERRQARIHFGLVCLALILPVPPVIVVLLHDDYKYTIADYPPYFCLSKSLNMMVFYSQVVVLNLLLAAGVCLFIPIFYVIHKHRLAIRTKKKPKWRVSTVGRKILITLCYFVVFGVVSLVYLAVVLAEQERILNIQESYFLCELPGNSSVNSVSSCDDTLRQLSDYNTLGAITFVLLAFLPLVIFTFMINWKRVLKRLGVYVRTAYQRCFPREEDHTESSTYAPVSSTISS